MPNLVGIGNSQVPTNAMLGGLAYQDPAHANLTEVEIENIAAIKAKINKTAEVGSGGVIFVYDTRKDSDGGAWRKRTRDTSWYNEGVGIHRGPRKEFPAVAVIVIEDSGTTLTIYDGDDPNMSMWMIIPTTANQQNMISGFNDHDLICVEALNGIMVVGTSPSWNHGNIIKVNFIKDDAVAICHTNDKLWFGGIANRNSNAYWQTLASGHYIVTNHVNGLAMGVLPNAPIDPETGLPIPTIAVACEGGITVFREDGSANDIVATSGGYVPVAEVAIHGNRLYSLSSPRLLYTFPLPWTSSTTGGSFSGSNGLVWMSSLQAEESDYSQCHILVKKNRDMAIATPTELLLVSPNYSMDVFTSGTPNILEHNSGRLTASIGTDYNSGWMVGDIKGAWLASTDDTDIVGGNLVVNSYDWTGASGTQSATAPNNWTGGNGATFKTDGATYIRLYNENDGGAGPNSFMTQSFTTVVGKTYAYSLTQMHHATITVYVRIGNSSNASDVAGSQSWVSSSSESVKFITGRFTATATTTYITLGIVSGSHNYSVGWDEVRVNLLEEDRSKDNLPLHTYGTITKTAVATGSELVAYSGNGTSNYFAQPYNANLAFGTDAEFTVMGWLYTTNVGGGQYIFDRSVTYNSSREFQSWIAADLRYITFYVGGGQTLHSGNYAFNNNVWFHFCFTRREGNMYLHINGIQIKTGASTVSTVASGNRELKVLYNMNSNTKMALFRMSSTSVTTDQIKRIYREELPLFQEDAKCTLYGSSNDIKAIGYDDSNDILHVGTSSGRSEMNGLKLINNTTTAITNAISASNGLVAEQ